MERISSLAWSKAAFAPSFFFPMESGSRINAASEEPPSHWSNLLGTLIALLTLTLPVGAIAYFSTSDSLPISPPASSMPLPAEE